MITWCPKGREIRPNGASRRAGCRSRAAVRAGPVGVQTPAVDTPRRDLPAWRRRTRGEHRWASALAVAVVIALQMLLPARTVPQIRYVLGALEIALLVALLVVNPFRVDRESSVIRGVSLALVGLVVLSNGWSAVLLVTYLVRGQETGPGQLLTAGAGIWVTNVLAFALVYWEQDRGGPAARAAGEREHPDLLFPQMQSPEVAAPDWEPEFADYLYLSFTNSTAFSPTDVLPLTRRIKLVMMVQSAVALVVVLLVVARAVNVLN